MNFGGRVAQAGRGCAASHPVFSGAAQPRPACATFSEESLMNRREFNLNLFCAAGALAFPARQSTSQLRVNGQRVNKHLAELSQFGKTPEGGTHRLAYSEADLQGREYAMK